MKQETFEQFLEANPYQNTRSFTKEDWESSMYEKWQDETKEVKEGGEWIADTAFQEYRRDGDKDADYYTCFVFVKETGGKDKLCDVYGDTKEEAEERAKIIAQSKNMYYALKRLYNAIDSCIDLTPELLRECNSVLQKATTKK